MNRRLIISIMSALVLVTVFLASFVIPRIERGRKASKTLRANHNYLSDDGDKDSTYNNTIKLCDKCIVIDSGHGGIDPGKVSVYGDLEKDINLQIALKLKEKLEAAQIKVVMIRQEDEGLYSEADSNKKATDLKNRCNRIDESGADFAISIHQNSFSSPGVKGAQLFYYKGSEKGKKIAEILQNKFGEIQANNRTAKYDSSYYILQNTHIPVVIAECGFLSNPEEAKLLKDSVYQDRISMILYEGIIQCLIELE